MPKAKTAATADDLFIGVFPTGISYADRSRERGGDYLKLAFLPYDTLELTWYEPEAKVPAALRTAILADARRVAAKRGQAFPTSTSGQTVTLGGRDKKTVAQLDAEIEDMLSTSSASRPNRNIIVRLTSDRWPGGVKVRVVRLGVGVRQGLRHTFRVGSFAVMHPDAGRKLPDGTVLVHEDALHDTAD